MSYQFGRPSRFAELSDPTGPTATREWQEFLQRREDLLDQIMGRIQARQDAIFGARTYPGDPNPADVVDDQINTQALMSQEQRLGFGTSEYNDLLGQAEFYGISNPESVRPQELEVLINRRRSGVLNERINAGEFEAGIGERAVDAIQTGLGTIFTGSTKALIDMSQRVPFIGDALARTETIRKADQWINKVAEGYRGGLTGDEEMGWRIANGMSGMLGYALPAAASYSLLAEIPVVAGLSPILRGAIAGGGSAWMMEGGGDAPLSERGMAVGLGAGLGGAGEFVATSVLPRLFAKAQRSFHSKVGGSPSTGTYRPAPTAADDPLALSNVVEGEWRFEEDLLLESGAQPRPSEPTGPRVRLDDAPASTQAPQSPPEPIGFNPASRSSDLERALHFSRGEEPKLLGTPQRNEMERLKQQINELIEQRNVARRQAETHPLTGLANRRAFELARATADADPNIGYVVMDARGFKQVNDVLGHSRGDEALQNFAQALNRAAQDTGVPARLFHFGGDEFAAIVPREQMEQFAETARKYSRQTFHAPEMMRREGFNVDLPLYHGTSKSFDEFVPRKNNAIYLTDDPNIAASYTDLLDAAVQIAGVDDETRVRSFRPNIRPVYARMRNPLVYDFEGQDWDSASAIVQHAQEAGYDSVILKNVIDVGPTKRMPNISLYRETLAEQYGPNAVVRMSDKEVYEEMLDNVNNPLLDESVVPQTQYVIFNPEDVKSQFGGLRTELDSFTGSTFDEADQGLMSFKSRNRAAGEMLSARAAQGEAIALTKQATIMESPALSEVATKPILDDYDVARALNDCYPGQTSVVKGANPSLLDRISPDTPLAQSDIRFVARTVPAAEEGFNVGLPLYHGTMRVFDEFAPGRDTYLTDRPDVAQFYAGTPPETYTPGTLAPNIRPVFARTRNPLVVDTGPIGFMDAEPLIDDARRRGFDSVILKNVIDPVGETGEDLVAQTQYVIFDPKDIRSQFEQPRVRLDALINATDKQAAQYGRYGMFEDQRVVTANGKEAVIVGFRGENVLLRSPMNKNLQYAAKMSNVMPLKSSGRLVDGQESYNEFVQEAMGKFSNEASQAGLPAFDWLSVEMSSQLPRYMDEYFQSRGIEGPTRGLLEEYFNYARVQDFKSLAPEEFAHAEQLQREASQLLSMRAEGQHDFHVSVEDMAAAKGFELSVTEPDNTVRFPVERTTGGPLERLFAASEGWDIGPNDMAAPPRDEDIESGFGVLRDQHSQLQVPVADEEAAREFLANFDREVPDHTPLSAVPAELLDIVPGGSGPTEGPEPTWIDTAHHTEWAEEAASNLEKDLIRINANNARGGGGGGGGTIPPRGEAIPIPPPPPPPSPGKQMRKADPRRLAQAMAMQDSLWMRFGEPIRNYFLRTEQHLREAGLDVELWRHYAAISNGMSIAHNEMNPWLAEWADIVSRFRHRIQRDGTVVKIEQLGNWNDKLAAMMKAGYTPEEIDAQAMIRPFFDRAWGEARKSAPIGYVFDYLPALRNLQARGAKTIDPWGQWERNHLPYEWKWFARYPRAHNTQARHASIADLGTMYIRALFFEKNVAPHWNLMKQDWADPAIPEALAIPINGWLDLVLTGVGAQHDVMISGTRQVMNKLGIPVSDTDVRSMFGGVLGTMYRAGLGLSPHTVFRDSIQPLFTGTEIGFKWVAQAYKNWGDPVEREAMWERALRGGWVQKGQAQVATSEVFSQQLTTVTGEPILDDRLAARRESWAKVLDRLYDITPRGLKQGIQGTKVDPLLAYTRLGEFNRLMAGDAGYQRALAALQQGGSEANILDNAGLNIYEAPIREHAASLLRAGNHEGFLNLAGNEAGNSQFRYGTMEAPWGIQQLGSTGRGIMMFGTFTTQYLARMRSNLMNFTRNGARGEAAAFLGRQTAIWAAITAASAATGWKALERYKWHRSLTFAGGPPALGALKTFQAGTGVLSTTLGQRPAPEQQSAMAQFGMRGMEAFFPYAGGIRTAQGMAMAVEGVAPVDVMARGLITGEWGTGRTFKSMFDNPEFIERWQYGSEPAREVDINDVLNDRDRVNGVLNGVLFDTTRADLPPRPGLDLDPVTGLPRGAPFSIEGNGRGGGSLY